MTFARWGLAGLLIPTLVTAQVNSRSVMLDWGTVRVVLAPDSLRGTLLWARKDNSQRDSSDGPSFLSYLNREATEDWIREAREFLAQPPSENDTSAYRASPLLVTQSGEVFILYRRADGKWSSERFIAFQSLEGQVVLSVWTRESSVLEFLSNLEKVLHATPPHSGPVVDTIPIGGTVPGATDVKHQSGTRDIRYPAEERDDNNGGHVWVSFVVLPNGFADMSSYEAVYTDSPGFERAVREGVRWMRFVPAKLNGRPIPVRVFQAFTFEIIGGSRRRR